MATGSGESVDGIPAKSGTYSQRGLFCDPEKADEIVRMYLAGKSGRDIAPTFGVSPATITRGLMGMGVPLRPSSRPWLYGEETRQIALRMHRAGRPLTGIAAEVGCSITTARALVYGGARS